MQIQADDFVASHLVVKIGPTQKATEEARWLLKYDKHLLFNQQNITYFKYGQRRLFQVLALSIICFKVQKK